MPTNFLHTPIDYLNGVGPARAKLLKAELGISTYGDLANLFPNRYIDKTKYYKINELVPDSAHVQIVGKVTHIKTMGDGRSSRLVATFIDSTGSMELVWFKGQKYFKDNLKLNVPYVIYGKVSKYGSKYNIAHPDVELLKEHRSRQQSAMTPIYPSTEQLTKRNVTNKMMVRMMQQLFSEVHNSFTETLSEQIRSQHQLVDKNTAMYNAHFPKSAALLQQSIYRLKFEELFFIQMELLLQNRIRKTRIKGYAFEKVGERFNDFYSNHLPFELTGAQKRVVKEIRADMGTGAHMNRLLQGDVGSGKTIVAVLTCLLAIDNGFQACIMAPTEILAQQHYQGVSELLEKTGLKVSLLTGSVKTKARRVIHSDLEDGTLNILIGTHALIEDKVVFKNLGVAIVDEQHRFGVAQRAKLWKKNDLPPHVLVMTATPIPRTLAMSLYGDLDISVIDELPPGRKEIKTVHRYDKNRLAVFSFLKEEITKGRQIYLVYPLIEESETLDYKDLMDGYESVVREFPTPQYQVSIVHGRMKPEDKDYEMERFVKGETQIMVATTVIEVGVNVPNASVMVIESAERFGLSQLHQLRGRVGRGADQSFCILMTSYKLSTEAKTRVETMVATTDGFEIAEVDLKLRGPGDMMGTRQSGVLALRVADIVKDNDILAVARETAKELLQKDATLALPENTSIKKVLQFLQSKKGLWKYIS
ncbi:ATP-dependent DNA helicase RecG [Nonlabens ulvanivorans]|uniref:ATP-dependent DNA helicase RecG n=2 Tax=Nonlabens ulvanivorans TaxID=906888 RepID=A0A084JVW2_NONUL|nr:ATP-dependent DNA helicase RecG [Nonlabens ulvanivorans]KEZ93096.1 ATP-dependent DNA helicase [Nonlabens ulvanivorans]PRX13785.1 ATP-dependent DNA helicase RecG [Nonlabens ulvanivorans]